MASVPKNDAATIGVDLGGSHITALSAAEDGTVLYRSSSDVNDRSFKAVLKLMISVIRDVASKTKSVRALGIGSPGNIDLQRGIVRYSPNFGWTDIPLGEELRRAFDVPIFIGNDARCATLGEHTYGSGIGRRNFALLTLGTGIGGGVVADGVLLMGNSAAAGEFGHHQIRSTDGFICGCGKMGCFEAQASGMGLLRHACALASSFPRSTLLGEKPYEAGSKVIRKAAEAGDMHALSAWHRFIDDLACGLANVIAFVNPELIALGGGLSSAGDFLLNALRPKVDALTTMSPKGIIEIVRAVLENDAGAIGAAVMARRGGLVTASLERRADGGVVGVRGSGFGFSPKGEPRD
jgi:glucokinase